MVNTILKINHSQMIEVEGFGQETINAARKEYPNAHIVLVGFKNTSDNSIIKRDLSSQYDVNRK